MFKVVFPWGIFLKIGSQLRVLHPSTDALKVTLHQHLCQNQAGAELGFHWALWRTGCSAGWKAAELFLLWPGVKIAVLRCCSMSHPPGSCSSWRFKARQFPVCLSLVCHLLRHQAELQTARSQGRAAWSSAEETPGPGRARVPGHVCFHVPELLFSPQTAIRACPPCIMHAQLHLHVPWDCHCQDKSSFSPCHCSPCSGLAGRSALPSNTSSHYKSVHI